jgi:8-oxo-dGTP pyrophosphatase MutT (NUDIX family)
MSEVAKLGEIVAVALFDPTGNILIIRRAADVDIEPDKSAVPAGHVEAADESIADTAAREALEEIGVVLDRERVVKLGEFMVGPLRGHLVGATYPGEASLKVNTKEIQEARPMPFDEFGRHYAQHTEDYAAGSDQAIGLLLETVLKPFTL